MLANRVRKYIAAGYVNLPSDINNLVAKIQELKGTSYDLDDHEEVVMLLDYYESGLPDLIDRIISEHRPPE